MAFLFHFARSLHRFLSAINCVLTLQVCRRGRRHFVQPPGARAVARQLRARRALVNVTMHTGVLHVTLIHDFLLCLLTAYLLVYFVHTMLLADLPFLLLLRSKESSLLHFYVIKLGTWAAGRRAWTLASIQGGIQRLGARE